MKKMFSTCIVMILSLLICIPQTFHVYAAEDTLRILATSDVHNRFVGYDYATNAPTAKGGFSRVATLIEKNRTANTVLLDNGDTIQGNSAILFNKDAVQPMVKALNLMNYDTYTTGNHEYNYGMDFVEKLKQTFKGEFLTANVYKGNPIPANRIAKNYTILNKNGIRVAVIGVVTPHITRWDAANLAGYTVTNPYDEVKSAVKEIKGSNLSDVIVVSFHASIDGEYGNDSSKEIANLVPEVDVVIAGHAHETRIERSKNDSVIIEPGSSGSHLAMVDLKLTKSGTGYTINRKDGITAVNLAADNKVSESPIITTNLAEEHKRAVTDASTIIGKLSGGNLVPDAEVPGIPQSQLQDTGLIDIILNTQLDEAKKGIGTIPNNVHHVSSAAVFNTSTNVLEGALTKSDVAKIYQFDNTLETMSIKGSMLKTFMEADMKYYNQYQPGDLTISFNSDIRAYNYDIFQGVDYTVDIAKPAGERVASLVYSDTKAPVGDNDMIYLTVNNYRASYLRNTFPEFKDAKKVYESLGQQTDLIRDMIKNRIIKEQTIKPEYDNNWKVVHPAFDPIDRQIVEKLVREKQLEVPRSADGRTPNVKSLTSADIADHKNIILATTDDLSTINENDTTPFGSMVTNYMKEAMHADVAALSKSLLSNPWKSGSITNNSIYTSVPFNQSIGLYTISNTQLETLIKENIEPSKMHLEYSGFALETYVENDKISITKLTKEDGSVLANEMTIALSKDLASKYGLKEAKPDIFDLQDLLRKQIEPLDHLKYQYTDFYNVKVAEKTTEKEVNTKDATNNKVAEKTVKNDTLPDTRGLTVFNLFGMLGVLMAFVGCLLSARFYIRKFKK